MVAAESWSSTWKGDTGPEERFGAGQGLEPLVGRGDIFLPVEPLDAAGGASDLGGKRQGRWKLRNGQEVVVEEDVDLGD